MEEITRAQQDERTRTKRQREALARASELVEVDEEDLSAFRILRMDAETFAAARAAQRELAALGRHRVPIPGLLIAACAQQHGAGVLHVDRHYEALAGLLEFDAYRVTPTA
jgi:predicted nucleic acid-binding protein